MSKKNDEDANEGKQVEETETEDVAVEEAKVEEKVKRKKVIRRKSKKEKENPINAMIRLTVESGKVDFGSRSSVKSNSKNAKLFVVAKNTPKQILAKLKTANVSNVPVFTFEGSTVELGSICGKPYPVSVMSVYDFGNADVKSFLKKD
ncbi:MAG: 50S ribosomal protein L30e [Candidatus Micrarchaeota archaeon]